MQLRVQYYRFPSRGSRNKKINSFISTYNSRSGLEYFLIDTNALYFPYHLEIVRKCSCLQTPCSTKLFCNSIVDGGRANQNVRSQSGCIILQIHCSVLLDHLLDLSKGVTRHRRDRSSEPTIQPRIRSGVVSPIRRSLNSLYIFFFNEYIPTNPGLL